MSDNDEVKRLMEIVTADLRDHERRIASLELNDAKQDVKIAEFSKTLEKIEQNTTWTYRLVVGAIVSGAIGGAITLLFRLAVQA